jgi:hypothetical protein
VAVELHSVGRSPVRGPDLFVLRRVAAEIERDVVVAHRRAFNVSEWVQASILGNLAREAQVDDRPYTVLDE